MTSRVSSKNKEKKAKGKNIFEKKRPNRKTKNGTKKQKTASPEVCTFKQLLDHCTTVTHMI